MKRIETTVANVIDRIVILCMPIVMGVVGVLLLRMLLPDFKISKDTGLEIVKSIFDVWGILLGFVITAVSILLTANKNDLIETLIATNHMQSIIFSYITASAYLLIAIVYALVLLIFQVWGNKLCMIFIALNIVIILSVGISIYFLFVIMFKMNKNIC